jgi:ABC-type Fe3+-hydroxamate transport system substrate-binding protein
LRSTRTLSLLLLLAVCGCDTEEAGDRPPPAPDDVGVPAERADSVLQITDMAGRTLVSEGTPQRILSLVPSATETLLSLGARGLLVGRTDYDTASALLSLPSVGGGLHPSAEAIVALDPDLVIRFAGESDPGTTLELDRLGIPHFAIAPDRITDIRRIIRDLGVITARGQRASQLLAGMDSTLSRIRTRVQDRPRVRVAYLLGGDPPWVAGGGTYIGELMEIGGGENVFSDLGELYGPVNAEVFLALDIELFLAAEGSQFSLPETAAPLRRVSPGVEVPGPHLARAALEMARAIHPEAFR